MRGAVRRCAAPVSPVSPLPRVPLLSTRPHRHPASARLASELWAKPGVTARRSWQPDPPGRPQSRSGTAAALWPRRWPRRLRRPAEVSARPGGRQPRAPLRRPGLPAAPLAPGPTFWQLRPPLCRTCPAIKVVQVECPAYCAHAARTSAAAVQQLTNAPSRAPAHSAPPAPWLLERPTCCLAVMEPGNAPPCRLHCCTAHKNARPVAEQHQWRRRQARPAPIVQPVSRRPSCRVSSDNRHADHDAGVPSSQLSRASLAQAAQQPTTAVRTLGGGEPALAVSPTGTTAPADRWQAPFKNR